MLTEYSTIPNMSRKGDGYDNAAMESFFAALKLDLVVFEDFLTKEGRKPRFFSILGCFTIGNDDTRPSAISALSSSKRSTKCLN